MAQSDVSFFYQTRNGTVRLPYERLIGNNCILVGICVETVARILFNKKPMLRNADRTREMLILMKEHFFEEKKNEIKSETIGFYIFENYEKGDVTGL